MPTYTVPKLVTFHTAWPTDPVTGEPFGEGARALITDQVQLDRIVAIQKAYIDPAVDPDNVGVLNGVSQINGGAITGGNFLRNGNFDIWQRGPSPGDLAPGEYGADGWAATVGQYVNMSRQAFVAGGEHPGNSLYVGRMSGHTTVSTWLKPGQGVPHSLTQFLRGKTITFSGYLRSSAASWSVDPGFIRSRVGYTIAAADGPFSGDYRATALAQTTIATQGSLPTSWVKFETSQAVPVTANNVGVEITVANPGLYTLANWFELSQLKLEITDPDNPVSTPFAPVDPALELAMCQRYFERLNADNSDGVAMGYSHTTAQALLSLIHRPKRVAPVVTPSAAANWSLNQGGTTTALTSFGAAHSNLEPFDRMHLEVNVASGLTVGGASILRPNTNGQYIDISSEL